MSIVGFLVGIRGAGKTTVLERLRSCASVLVLTPSTTRKRRSPDETEYDFVEKWDSELYEWEIQIGGERYGMRKSELARADTVKFAITVFDPGSIGVLKDYRETTTRPMITIGLDTIESIEEQSRRTKRSASRAISEREFDEQLSTVRNCDVVLKGDTDVLVDAIMASIECLNARGGVLHKPLIERLVAAGALLENAEGEVSPAGYDLRLGDDVWCQGKFIRLTPDEPALRIPAYSYAIVSAVEMANLPVFVAARFGLKNSLFFQGVVQSNGPQIDPGYRGALFCMLYNGSDQPIGLMRGRHFSTIEFITTCGNGAGYQGKYQGMTSLRDFMPASAAVSKGGQILEKTERKIADVVSQWTVFRNVLLAFLALIVAPAYVVYFDVWSKWQDTKAGVEEKIAELNEMKQELLELQSSLEENVSVSSSQPSEAQSSAYDSADQVTEGRGVASGNSRDPRSEVGVPTPAAPDEIPLEDKPN